MIFFKEKTVKIGDTYIKKDGNPFSILRKVEIKNVQKNWVQYGILHLEMSSKISKFLSEYKKNEE